MAKTKFIVHACAYCHRQTKMELVGEMQGSNGDSDSQRAWYRCTRCKHSALIDRTTLAPTKATAMQKIDRDACVEYAQDKVFDVGQTIYHAGLDDVGMVTAKVKISNGVHAITVTFEKLGEKRLVENVPISTVNEPAPGA